MRNNNNNNNSSNRNNANSSYDGKRSNSSSSYKGNRSNTSGSFEGRRSNSNSTFGGRGNSTNSTFDDKRNDSNSSYKGSRPNNGSSFEGRKNNTNGTFGGRGNNTNSSYKGNRPNSGSSFEGRKNNTNSTFEDRKNNANSSFEGRNNTSNNSFDSRRNNRNFRSNPRNDSNNYFFDNGKTGDTQFKSRNQKSNNSHDFRNNYEDIQEYRKNAFNSFKGESNIEPAINNFANEEQSENTINDNILIGRNPIREALKGTRDIEKLLVQKGELGGSAREIISSAREKRIIIQEVEKNRLDQIALKHQGLIAFVSAYNYHTIDEMLELAKSKNEDPFIILLDKITDPHNLGAVIRTAECVGAHGVIIPKRRSVGLNSTVAKTSAGAAEHLMVSRENNLVSTIEILKKKGLWAYAADLEGEDYTTVDYSGPLLLVIGAEGDGISKLVLEHCDKRLCIPLSGKVQSLNASVAAGVLMFEINKGRKK